MSDQQTEFDLSYQQRPDEKQEDWVGRIRKALGMLDQDSPEFEPGIDDWLLGEQYIVEAWNGAGYVRLITPPTERCSISENQNRIPPYQVRDMNDEVIGPYDYYATFDQAYMNAKALALTAEDHEVQIINAFSNTCAGVGWEDMPD